MKLEIQYFPNSQICLNELSGISGQFKPNGGYALRVTDKIRTRFQVETVKSGNSTPCECMANSCSERMDCVGGERSSLSQLSRQWQGVAV